MEVKVISSGSHAGNCIYVGSNGMHILIDVGLPKTKLPDILMSHGVNPADIKAVFLTHEHGDHKHGIGFAQKYQIPVYATPGTITKINNSNVQFSPIPYGSTITLGPRFGDHLTVYAFKVSHDAEEPAGFVIRDHEHIKASFVMDTGQVTQTMLNAMMNSSIYCIEANHDLTLLELNEDYHDGLKARIKSDDGHLSNEDCSQALRKLVEGRGERIILTHLSSKNNTVKLATRAVNKALKTKGLEMDTHYTLEVC